MTEQKKSGNSYYIAYYTINGKQKKFSSGVQYTGKRKDENLAFSIIKSKIEREEEALSRTVIGDINQRFVDFAEHHLATRPYKTKSTKETYLKLFKARVKPYFTENPIALKDITKLDIKDFVEFLYADECSPKYVKNIHGMLVNILESAEERNLCQNVAKGVKLIPPDEFDNIVIYDDKDRRAMIEASKTVDNAELMVGLLCLTGMRIGELQELQWKHFDSKNREIRIVKSKTNAGKRVLSLCDDLCDLLVRAKENQVMYKKLFAETYNDNDYIIKQIDGNRYSFKQIRKRVKAAMKKAQLKEGRVHDIRHSVAVNLIEKNQNIYSVSQYLGHKNIQSTMRYLHFTSIQNKEIASALQLS
jgi:integrase